MCEYKDPRTALLQMRKHAAWYIKGMKGAAELRKRAFKITDISELEGLAYDIVKEEKESDFMKKISAIIMAVLLAAVLCSCSYDTYTREQ